ncbi:MAG: type II toxin-antitoxin system VapC family toxin [bacterium]|nr:type II toxin-antitoxin system VapC family toxin [bacterium]
MTDYLLDTNHVTQLLADNQNLVRRVRFAAREGARFGISITVLGELYFAVFASQRRDENLDNLRNFINDIILWPFDEESAEEFGRIQADQKRKGQSIPPTDSQIAAVCRLRGLTLLSDDDHFDLVSNLRVENWLKPTKKPAAPRRRRPAGRKLAKGGSPEAGNER